MSRSELLLGIDVGTASSKGALVAADGEVVRVAVREHGVSLPRPGWVEQDAEAVWWGECVALCHELLAGIEAPIAAVGASGIGPCLLPCDARDRPLRPAILYGVDTRAEAEAAEVTERLGAERILTRGGSALSSQALGPKLLWLARHEPEVWAAMRRWHTAGSFLVARLTGEWVLDHQFASQCDPFYEMASSFWAEDWVGEVLPGLALPPLAWAAEVVGEVSAEAAAATGLTAGTPVVAGTIDAWAEAKSVGVTAPGELMVMYGSTMFFVLGAEVPADDPSVWTTAGTEPGSLTRAAGMATSGSLTAWLREMTGAPDFGTLVAEAAATAPGADGLLVLPYFAGERTPLLDPRARGSITGLTLRHTRGHLYRAALEGISFGARHNLETLAGQRPHRVVAVGGGTRGELWTQIVSDVTGLEQELPAQTLGAAYGDALLAAEGAGLVAPGSSWAQTAGTVTPRPEWRGLYDDRYRLYRDLHAATVAIQHELAETA
ncbi:MAG TPA: FGGY family carbohydrate kinase [Solirubrobacterales bacterium]|nr:FGGY family carbohydrate kinase [Solirubrobacterales bacterium]